MNQSVLRSIKQEIYRRFPDFSGVQPKVQVQQSPQAKSASASPTYLLIFQNRVSTAGNKTMSRWVRVVANEQGKILKITTSR